MGTPLHKTVRTVRWVCPKSRGQLQALEVNAGRIESSRALLRYHGRDRRGVTVDADDDDADDDDVDLELESRRRPARQRRRTQTPTVCAPVLRDTLFGKFGWLRSLERGRLRFLTLASGPLPEQGQPPRPGKVALTYAALSIVLWLEWRLHATCRSVGRGAELVVWLPRG